MNMNEYKIYQKDRPDSVLILALDQEDHKCALLKSKDGLRTQQVKTDYIVLKTNVEIADEKQVSLGYFHVIKCTSDDMSVNRQFERVCLAIFNKACEEITTDTIIDFFQDLQRLFETSSEKDTHTLQIGVYGEMAFLKYCFLNGRADIANKWHSDFYNKHDIELSKSLRMEIKTTGSERRIHLFKHNQLVKTGIDVLVCSIMIEECEVGENIYELMNEVQLQLTNTSTIMLIEKLKKRCGLSDENTGIICEETGVIDSIRIYRAEDVPHLTGLIPPGITNISYSVNLDAELPTVSLDEIIF